MNTRLLVGAACAALAFSSVSARAQLCGEGCLPPSCGEGQECAPPPPPSLPNAPSGDGTPYATFFTLPNGNVVDGGTAYNTGIPRVFTFGGGQGVPFTDNQFYFGGSDSNVTFQTNHQNASVSATAHQDPVHGRSDASISLAYTVSITAANGSVADQIAAILAHNPLASANGGYTLSASGFGRAIANGSSAFGPNGSTAYHFGAVCNPGDATCGTHNWSILLGFARGTAFSDGDANTFYASFSFGGSAAAGLGGLGVYPGDASVFVDPTIKFNQQLSQFGNQISFNVGTGGLGNGGFGSFAGGVPEPASWALMLGGFGLLGGAARRRRVTFAAA